MPKAAVFLLSFAAALFLFAEKARPQGAAAVGTVTDTSNAVVPSARVTVEHLDTGVQRATETNDAGAFIVPGLPMGNYRVRASFENFKTAESSEFTLHVGQERRVDLTLEPGDVSETITVEAGAATAATENATVATIVDQRNIAELPLNGRQLQNLALLVPGVTAGWNWTTAANRYGKARENLEGAFVVNGARGRSNNFVLDGMPMNVRQYGVMNFEPSNEAVHEFELKTSVPEAEFGHTMGSTVNIVTRGGTNEFHGSVYEFFRNDKLDSNDTFNNRAGLPRGKLRQNQFGGSVGGPIVRNRHFFFANVELLRIIEGVETRVVSVPTAEEKAGRITYLDSSGAERALDLSDRIAPLSARLLELYPAPNSSGPGGLNYNSSLTIALNDYQTHVRTDHHLSSRDTLNVRFSYNLNGQNYVINRFGGPYVPGFSLPNPEATRNMSIGHTHTFGPTAVNEFRIGFNRYANDLANGDQTTPSEIGLPNGNETANGIPSIHFLAGNIDSLGGLDWFNREQNETTVVITDSLSWLRGRHNIKIGGQLARLHYNTRGASNQRGTVSFDGSRNGLIPNTPENARSSALADLLLGLPLQASITVGEFGRGYRQWTYSGFVQDAWRATSNLTVNFGLRYDYSAPWTEVNDKLTNLVPGQGLALVGSPGLDHFYEPDRNNFGPRFGIAYDLGGEGKTILRAGVGVLYETLQQANSVQPVENNPPFSAAAVTRQPTPFSTTDLPSTTLLDLRADAQPSNSIAAVATEDFRNPYTVQFNFSIQRRLGRECLAEVGYAATRGQKLPIFVNLNQVPIESLTADQRAAIQADIDAGRDTTATLAPLRLYPQYDSILYSSNVATSTFHSAQFKLEKRFGAGPAVLTSYTVGKSIDTASDYDSGDASEQVLNARDIDRQRALSSFDVKHRFTAAFNYLLPFARLGGPRALLDGWQINGIVTLQSGQPFTPFVSLFDPYRNESYNRPDAIGDPNANVPDGLAFNPAAFRAPAPGTFGTAGRNIIRGDGFQSVDLSLFKNIPVTERIQGQFRAEFVNSFNHVNFQGPATNLTSTPGLFVAAAQPRIVQLGFKLSF